MKRIFRLLPSKHSLLQHEYLKHALHKNGSPLESLNHKGVTLVELMIVLSILAIIGTIGIPSFLSITTSARISSATNELNSLIRLARFTAIDQSAHTVLCPSIDFERCSAHWNASKMVFVDRNHNTVRDLDEPVIMSMSGNTPSVVMHSRKTAIKFYQSGITASPAGVNICARSNEAQYARRLTVSLQGKVRLSRDQNNDNVHEDTAGRPLTCV